MIPEASTVPCALKLPHHGYRRSEWSAALLPARWDTHGYPFPALWPIYTRSTLWLRATLPVRVSWRCTRKPMACGVQFSTALQDANQCIAVTRHDSPIVRRAEPDDEAFNRMLGGHSMQRWGVVTSDEHCGMLIADS